MESYFLRGILIGLLFGLPIGAVGTMTVQRTWSFGFRAGMLSGLGSSVADCLYAGIGVFGLTFISDFLWRYQKPITFLGGGIILLMGLQLIFKPHAVNLSETQKTAQFSLFLSAVTVGVTNPAAILTFIFAFSYFGIIAGAGTVQGVFLVSGVFIGTYLWWITLTAVTCALKKKAQDNRFRYMNQIFGSLLTLFGVVILGRMLR